MELTLDGDAARGDIYQLGCVAGSALGCRKNTLSDQCPSIFKFVLRRAKNALPGSAWALLLFARVVFSSKFCKWPSSSKFSTKF